MELTKKFHDTATKLGASFFGIADLTPAFDAIHSQGGEMVSSFPRAISIGIGLPHAVVDQLPQQMDVAVIMNYRHHAYDIINQRLDHITSKLSSMVQSDGYRALPVPASQQVNHKKLCGIFSNKLAAHLAGLGWIGKSCLLVTPQVGPRVRWATVLTNAPLEPAVERLQDRCGKCRECVDICPPQAFTGRPFHEDEPREARFAADKCSDYLQKREDEIGDSVCGLCLYVCPYGRKSSRDLQESMQ